MDATHRMIEVADDGDALLYHCERCLRQVVIRRSGGFTVLQQGDFFASHTGGHGPLEVSAA